MSRFVQVPVTAIRSRLVGAGFTLVVLGPGGGEEVYERPHNRDARYVIRVRVVSNEGVRIVALFMGMVSIFSSTCVFRAGTVDAVLDMMIEQAGEAYDWERICGAREERKS